MKFVDVASDRRVSALMELIDSLGRTADPREALEELVRGLPGGRSPRGYVELSTRGGAAGAYRIRRLRATLDSEWRPLAPPAQDIGPFHSGGVLGQIIRTPIPKIIHSIDLSADPVLPAEMADYHSAMAMPLFSEQAPGDWVILFDPQPDGFSSREMEELIVRGNLVAAMIGNLSTARRLCDANLKIQEEISGIAAIQRSLLPDAVPTIPGLKLAASYEALGQAGGDLYDFVPLGQRPGHLRDNADERWAMLIGDVSGHGAAAAVVMAMLHSILHAFPQRPQGPAEVMRHVNRHLCAKGIGPAFATAFLGIYDPATRELAYTRAGHPPPLLADWSGKWSCSCLDAVGDLPLGIDAEEPFTQASVRLSPGQSLVLYTDGITEAKNSRREFFEVRGLETAVAQSSSDADDVVLHVQQALMAHAPEIRPADDQTIVVAQVI